MKGNSIYTTLKREKHFPDKKSSLIKQWEQNMNNLHFFRGKRIVEVILVNQLV